MKKVIKITCLCLCLLALGFIIWKGTWIFSSTMLDIFNRQIEMLKDESLSEADRQYTFLLITSMIYDMLFYFISVISLLAIIIIITISFKKGLYSKHLAYAVAQIQLKQAKKKEKKTEKKQKKADKLQKKLNDLKGDD